MIKATCIVFLFSLASALAQHPQALDTIAVKIYAGGEQIQGEVLALSFNKGDNTHGLLQISAPSQREVLSFENFPLQLIEDYSEMRIYLRGEYGNIHCYDVEVGTIVGEAMVGDLKQKGKCVDGYVTTVVFLEKRIRLR